jgi:hypothetical protein
MEKNLTQKLQEDFGLFIKEVGTTYGSVIFGEVKKSLEEIYLKTPNLSPEDVDELNILQEVKSRHPHLEKNLNRMTGMQIGADNSEKIPDAETAYSSDEAQPIRDAPGVFIYATRSDNQPVSEDDLPTLRDYCIRRTNQGQEGLVALDVETLRCKSF